MTDAVPDVHGVGEAQLERTWEISVMRALAASGEAPHQAKAGFELEAGMVCCDDDVGICWLTWEIEMLGDWINDEVGILKAVAEGALTWDIDILGICDVSQQSLLDWADDTEAEADLDCLDVVVLDPEWVGVSSIPALYELDSLGVDGAGVVLDISWLQHEGVGLTLESIATVLDLGFDGIGVESSVWADLLEECVIKAGGHGSSRTVREGTTAGDEETLILGCGCFGTTVEGPVLAEACTTVCNAAIALVADLVDAFRFDGFFPAFLRVSDLASS